MRGWTCLALGLMSAPAAAGDWSLEYRPSLNSGVDSDGPKALQLAQSVALSPVSVGPKLDLHTSLDLGGGKHLSRTGLGLRQNLPLGLSVAGHGLFVTRWGGDARYRADAGLQGSVDWDLLKMEKTAVGLHTYGGATPSTKQDPLWWAGAGVMIRFGG